jgi:hypothetical protein
MGNLFPLFPFSLSLSLVYVKSNTGTGVPGLGENLLILLLKKGRLTKAVVNGRLNGFPWSEGALYHAC